MIEKDRIFEFLAKLNNELDEVWGRILGCEILTSTHKVFSEVQREESHMNVMIGKEISSALAKSKTSALNIALATKKSELSTSTNDPKFKKINE